MMIVKHEVTAKLLRILLLVSFGVLLGWLAAQFFNQVTEQTIQSHDRPLLEDDLQYHAWNHFELYVRDTTHVDTVCVDAPQFLANSYRTNEGPRLLDTQLPAFTLLPMDGQRPAVSTTTEQVTIQTYSPNDARGMSFTYDIPEPSWLLYLQGSTTLSQAAQRASVSVLPTYQQDNLQLSVGPTMLATPTSAGFGLTASLRYELLSR